MIFWKYVLKTTLITVGLFGLCFMIKETALYFSGEVFTKSDFLIGGILFSACLWLDRFIGVIEKMIKEQRNEKSRNEHNS